MGVLEKKPGVQNWIERLPGPMRAAWNRSIIYRAATHMHRERGMPVGHAIASAINWAKHICSTGDVKQWKGPQSVRPTSRAECCAAVALWTAMKAAAKTDNANAGERALIDMAAESIRLDMAGGLVPATITVRSKNGKTFQRRIMVRPKQAKAMKGKAVSERGLKVTKEQTAVLSELSKIPKDQRPKGWEKVVKTLVDPRHGGRLGPEKRRLLHGLANAAKGTPLEAAARQALKADAAKPSERKKGKRVTTGKPRKIQPAKGKHVASRKPKKLTAGKV